MENLEIRTKQKKSVHFEYKKNLNEALVFLKHPEDKIKVIERSESVEIQIYQNGNMLFSGDKYELFEKLKAKNQDEQ